MLLLLQDHHLKESRVARTMLFIAHIESILLCTGPSVVYLNFEWDRVLICKIVNHNSSFIIVLINYIEGRGGGRWVLES